MHAPGVRLAERLVELLALPARVFFANSGAEANECALKIARLHGRTDGRAEIVSCNNSFHGRTLGALSVTGNPAKRDPFEPLPGPVTFVEYGDDTALRAAVGPQTSAVIVEPTLGEGGVVPPPAGFLAAARAACDSAGALLIVDEVQSGIGRTGHWFATQAEGVRPDVITLAKGLGGGLPIGACLAVGAAGELFAPGDHGSTFGGNPVACAAALAVLATIADEHLLDNVKRVGEHLAHRLDEVRGPLVAGVRGSGLWRAVALTGEHAAAVESAARRRGLLVNAVKPNAIRLAPPLIIGEADVDEAVPLLQSALDEVSPR
jgi:acetylornithine aminotransferase